MISIVCQGDRRYKIYRSGDDIGCITVSDNPYHNTHCYLNLGLSQYDPSIATELFSCLRGELGQPLQVMCFRTQKMQDFLTAGGLECKRRCFEVEVSSSDLAFSLSPELQLYIAQKGTAPYDACCSLLYGYYSATHAPISPLTVPQDIFVSKIPETVLYNMADGKIIHYAFVEPGEIGYEIAYVGTADLPSFPSFARTLVYELFQKCNSLAAECDDTDPAAMELMHLFHINCSNSYDTYILA